MEKVLTLSESAELELLKNVLEAGGIRCVLKNVQLAQAMPLTPFDTELWVLNDDDLPQAQALCHDWFNPKPKPRAFGIAPSADNDSGVGLIPVGNVARSGILQTNLLRKEQYYENMRGSVD